MKKIISMFVAALLLFSVDASAQCSCGANGGMKREPVKMILDADFGSSTDDFRVSLLTVKVRTMPAWWTSSTPTMVILTFLLVWSVTV